MFLILFSFCFSIGSLSLDEVRMGAVEGREEYDGVECNFGTDEDRRFNVTDEEDADGGKDGDLKFREEDEG
jgi:hypothetical protein